MKQMAAKIRILVVDDEPDLLELISQTVRLMGYESRTAANGLEALALLQKDHYRLVISDIRMPLMGGLELLKEIRCSHLTTGVILTSGYFDNDKRAGFIKAGADDFIAKPFDCRELEEKITLLLAKKVGRSVAAG